MQNFLRGLFACLFLTLASACGSTIGVQNPQPNVALVPRATSLRLVLGAGIPNHLTFTDLGPDIDVESWRTTLQNGFQNAFGGAYRLTSSEDADLTLTLDEVRLELGDYGRPRARIQYKATLSRGAGVLRRTAGIAKKPFGGYPIPRTAYFAAHIDGAVEAMYEQIAKNLSVVIENAPEA